MLLIFGSCVRGDLAPESDADVAYLAPDGSSNIPWPELIPALPVDAHNLEKVSVNLGNEIAHAAILLFESQTGSFLAFAEAAKKRFEADAPKRERARRERVGIPSPGFWPESRGVGDMAMYSVMFSRSAAKNLADLPQTLTGSDLHRLQTGDYRTIFAINDKDKSIWIEDILHRKGAYR